MKFVCILLIISLCLVTIQGTTSEPEGTPQESSGNEESPVVKQLLQGSSNESEANTSTEETTIFEEVEFYEVEEEIEVEQMVAQMLSPKSFSGYKTIPVEKLEKTMTLQVCKKIKLMKDTLESSNEVTDDYFTSASLSLTAGVDELKSTIGEASNGYATEEELNKDSSKMQATIDSLINTHMEKVQAELNAEYEKYGCPELEKDKRNQLFLKRVFKEIKRGVKRVEKVGKKVIRAPIKVVGAVANAIVGGGEQVVEIVNVNTNVNNIDITNILNGNNCLSIPQSCSIDLMYKRPGGDKNTIIELACASKEDDKSKEDGESKKDGESKEGDKLKEGTGASTTP